MGSKSNAYENLLQNFIYGGSALTAPGTVYVGLWTATLSDASTGATAGEVSGGDYARVAMPAGTAYWTASDGGTVKNAVDVNFGTASADWGTITDWAALNASSAGTILHYGTLTASKAIASGDAFKIPVNSLVITED